MHLASDEDQWRLAEQRLRASMYFAASFTTAIRTLRANEAHNIDRGNDPKELSENSRFFLRRLFRAPSILAPLYFLSLTYHEEKLADKSYVSRDYLVSLYKPGELASILALIYLYHNLRRVCDPEDWGRYSKIVNDIIEIGGLIGRHLPELGFANSLLATGVRHLAAAVFLRTDPANFRIYRRDSKIQQRLLSLEIERRIWECTHVEIGTRILQLFGFGVPFAASFHRAALTPNRKELDLKSNRLRLTLVWSEALYLGVKPPVIKGEEQLIASESILDRILDEASRIREKGSKHAWLSKRKNAISPTLTPQLYKAGEGDAATANIKATEIKEVDEFLIDFDEMPEQMQSQFSETQISDLMSEIGDLIEEK
ncbi:MAG: hypothetical protein J5J00_12655 [Deltaproteobacteria bacterium]|nr:hypothetical protein [Deltaproteobacteria bacterium]